MSKRKKTKQEKKIADLNRKLHIHMQQAPILSQDTSSLYKSVLEKHISSPMTKSFHTQTAALSTSYVRTDLKKTFLFTFVIIAAQFVLLFLLKQHIIAFPLVSY